MSHDLCGEGRKEKTCNSDCWRETRRDIAGLGLVGVGTETQILEWICPFKTKEAKDLGCRINKVGIIQMTQLEGTALPAKP